VPVGLTSGITLLTERIQNEIHRDGERNAQDDTRHD
jgi:hypothetical protein